MREIKDGGPAFPMAGEGMMLRDWLAGMAMQAIISNQAMLTVLSEDEDETKPPVILPRIAYEMADAMLAERENRK